MEAPRVRPRGGRRQALVVAAVFLGVIVVWGLSMWVLSRSLRRTAYAIALERARRKTLDPFVRQARAAAVTCERAFQDPKARFKPVLWEVEEEEDGGRCAGRPALRFAWANPKDAAQRLDRGTRTRFTVVGVILELPREGRPLGLQYLGPWEGR